MQPIEEFYLNPSGQMHSNDPIEFLQTVFSPKQAASNVHSFTSEQIKENLIENFLAKIVNVHKLNLKV